MTEIIKDVGALRQRLDAERSQGHSIGVVPTMGALHEGHLALIDRARELADVVVVTIFVNPTQFGPGEDFERYPRQLEEDVQACRGRGAAIVFAPERDTMYPSGERTRVIVSGLDRFLCGASRPGHFEGVATIVTKLFAAVGSATAVFGRKDYQQLKIIERLARDLLFPITIDGHPIVREKGGLAMSSRNRYLSDRERVVALSLCGALKAAMSLHASGERKAQALIARMKSELESAGGRVSRMFTGFCPQR
jgi:pantoate--beta-alanine ligase